LGGRALEPGATVVLHLGAANRDPDKFPDAATFDVLRKQNRQIAFGFGAHFCLGAPLAREQGAVVFEALLPDLSRLQLKSPVPDWFMGNMSVRTLNSLEVSWSS
jgi:cytochrome P450